MPSPSLWVLWAGRCASHAAVDRVLAVRGTPVRSVERRSEHTAQCVVSAVQQAAVRFFKTLHAKVQLYTDVTDPAVAL